MGGILLAALAPGPRDTQVDEGDAARRDHDVARLEIAVDDGRVKELVKLAHRVAEVGEDAAHEVETVGRGRHGLRERLSGNVLHDHDETLVLAVALDDAGQVGEPRPIALGSMDPLVRAAQPGGQVLAHKGAQLGAVLLAHEVDALGGLQRPLLEHRVHAVAAIAVERGEVV